MTAASSRATVSDLRAAISFNSSRQAQVGIFFTALLYTGAGTGILTGTYGSLNYLPQSLGTLLLTAAYIGSYAFGAWLWLRPQARAFPVQIRAFIPILIYIFLSAVSVLYTVNVDATVRATVGLAGLLAVAVGYHRTVGSARILQAIWAACVVACALSLLLYIAAPDIANMSGYHEGNLRGVFDHKNQLGRVAWLGATLSAWRGLYHQGYKTLNLITFLACWSSLLLSSSVTSMLAALLTTCILAWWRPAFDRETKQIRLTYIGTSIPLGGAALLLASQAGSALLLERLDRDTGLTGRSSLWSSVIEAIADRPLLGFGSDAYWSAASDGLLSPLTVHGWTPSHAHSAYLDTTLGLGLFGLAATLAVLYASLRVAWLRRYDVVGVSIGAIVVGAMLLGVGESRVFLVPDSLPTLAILSALLAHPTSAEDS
jgi:exopolysaccharide production protein ExoQ